MRLDSKSDTSEVSPDAARADPLREKLTELRLEAFGRGNVDLDVEPERCLRMLDQRDARLAAIVQEMRAWIAEGNKADGIRRRADREIEKWVMELEG